MTSITSVEMNYLIFRYLQESGFTHSAFTLGYEAGINKCSIDGSMVPPGALITFVQRGLQYLEMEANLGNGETDVDEDFLFLQPLDIITKNVHELRHIVKEKKKNLQKEKDREKDKEKVKDDREKDRVKDREKSREKEKEKEREREKDREKEKERDKEKEREREIEQEREAERCRIREKARQEREKEIEKSRERKEKDKDRSKQPEDHSKEMASDQDAKMSSKLERNVPVDISPVSHSQPLEFSSAEVTVLEGHTNEVCTCAWSPAGSVLASGSGDSTARIWTVADGLSRPGADNGPVSVAVLKHVQLRTHEGNKDVTTLDWNGDGTLLATGAYDGQARIWNTNGELKSIFGRHKGPIFTLKWNKKGDYLLTGSCDRTAIVWDVKTEEIKQQFDLHTGAILDVDWRNNGSFATCSDNMIYVCKIGESRPVKTFSGHQSEVNCVKWDPTGSILASCSDDITAKIWSMKHDKYIHDLREHAKAIYTIRWSPTGPGTNNPNQQLLLASASFDATVKLWDVELGKTLCSLNGHKGPVYSVSFSPNSELLATGSMDKTLHIWSLKDRKIIKTYTGTGGIFEVCWNREGNKIAACFANNEVCVLDYRM
uniref:Uncharacterized protein n=1 Tax=Kalanchoe fedtschenkoi TaxID=63787 RepID=A0A7N0SYU1_KALFE